MRDFPCLGDSNECQIRGECTNKCGRKSEADRLLIAELRRQRDSARAVARVLAHSYAHDSRPPRHMVQEALTYPSVPLSIVTSHVIQGCVYNVGKCHVGDRCQFPGRCHRG